MHMAATHTVAGEFNRRVQMWCSRLKVGMSLYPALGVCHAGSGEASMTSAVRSCSVQLSTHALSHLEGQSQVAALLVDFDDGVTYVSQHQLAVTIVVQHVKGLLGLLRRQEGLQVLHDDVAPAHTTASAAAPRLATCV